MDTQSRYFVLTKCFHTPVKDLRHQIALGLHLIEGDWIRTCWKIYRLITITLSYHCDETVQTFFSKMFLFVNIYIDLSCIDHFLPHALNCGLGVREKQ